jgi:hypothetical protein
VEPVEVVAAEFAMANAVAQHPVNDHEQPVGDGESGLLEAGAPCDAKKTAVSKPSLQRLAAQADWQSARRK